jgi:thiamine-monophosphate kinase
VVAVTGVLGGSAGGLALLESGGAPPGDPDVTVLARMHREPLPRVGEGLILAELGVRCGMDLSDGLLGDAGKLAYASSVRAILELHRLPLPPALERRFGLESARIMALIGGEDYELLVAAPLEVVEDASLKLAERGLVGLTVVGRLEEGTSGEVTVVDERGQAVAPPRGSWDHFRHRESTA